MFGLNGRKINFNFILIFVGFIIEFGIFTFLRNQERYYFLPILWFFGGFLTFLGIFLERNNLTTVLEEKLSLWKINLAVFVISTCWVSYYFYSLCFHNPPDAKKADVVPTIITMTKRLMNFEFPFKPIDYGYILEPGYLTMQFAPFVVADKLNLDYRYFSFIILLGVLMLLVKWICTVKNIAIEAIVKSAIPFIIVIGIIKYNDGMLMHSVELMDAAFVVLLIYGLFAKNIWIISAAIVSCILTRYGILMWMPVLGIYLLRQKSKEFTTKVVLLSLAGILILYVLPFMTKDPMLFFKSMKNYDSMAKVQWEVISDWYAIKKPYTLVQGFGFAVFFNDFLSYDTLTKLKVIKYAQIALCLIVTTWFCFLFWKKENNINNEMLLLASLKIFMVIFYGFIFVPFSYLYIVPLFVSVAAIYRVNLLKDA